MMSNMTFQCVNTIQLVPSPFNSSPQCKKALYVIISGEIPENQVHKSSGTVTVLTLLEEYLER